MSENSATTFEPIPSELVSPDLMLHFGQMIIRSFAPKKQYTVSEWIDHVIEAKAEAGRKRKTVSSYKYCAHRVKAQIGEMKLHEVTPSDISELFISLKKDTVKSEDRAVLKSDCEAQAYLDRACMTKTRLAQISGLSQSTVARALEGHRVMLEKAERICSVLGCPLDEMFRIESIEKPLSATTLEDYRTFTRMIFSVAERELVIPYNPVKRTEKVIDRRKSKVKIFEMDQIEMLLEAAEQEPIDKKLLIHLLLVTGCRRGEIAGLRWSNVLWERSALIIDHSVLYTAEDGVYSEDTTKGGTDRLIHIPEETMQMLAEYKTWQDIRRTRCGDQWIQSDYIFTARTGGKISPETISGYIHRFQERYQLPEVFPHKFRHTHASALLYAGVDLSTVSERLGHQNVTTTEKFYIKAFLQGDVDSGEKIGQLIYKSNKTKEE